MQDLSPNFDRLGREKQGFLRWLVRFGASSTSGAMVRYLLAIASKFHCVIGREG